MENIEGIEGAAKEGGTENSGEASHQLRKHQAKSNGTEFGLSHYNNFTPIPMKIKYAMKHFLLIAGCLLSFATFAQKEVSIYLQC